MHVEMPWYCSIKGHSSMRLNAAQGDLSEASRFLAMGTSTVGTELAASLAQQASASLPAHALSPAKQAASQAVGAEAPVLNDELTATVASGTSPAADSTMGGDTAPADDASVLAAEERQFCDSLAALLVRPDTLCKMFKIFKFVCWDSVKRDNRFVTVMPLLYQSSDAWTCFRWHPLATKAVAMMYHGMGCCRCQLHDGSAGVQSV